MSALRRGEADRVEAAVPHTSKRIETAAVELFYLRGFKTTTMREIALACGLTPGALYNHFASKDELLATIMLDVHRTLEREIREAVDGAGDDPRDRLRAYCRTHALFHTRYLKEARVAQREIWSLRGDALEEVKALRRESAAMLRNILRDGVAGGAFDVPDEKVVANLILTMAVSIASWFRPDEPVSGDTIASIDAELALRMVNGDRERR
jgi:AcrR family transcriptional regulator